jgi:hypothetical protein
VAAVAASLLVGLVVGWTVFGGRPGGTEILVARASIEFGPPRGAEPPQPEVRVEGALEGYVTLIALGPDRRQVIIPPLGGDYVRVKLNGRSEPIGVPEDTTRVVYVVTETPASDPIEREFASREARRYAPDEAGELRTSLERFLIRTGYRRFAVGTSEVPREKAIE